MPELNQLYHLVTIAETGTLSKAAELIHMSQPSLTRSIQKLESELEVSLFDRQKNKITLNKTGELAVQYAKHILNDIDNMTKIVQSFERSLRTILIGSCAPGPIFELLSLLTERFPDMTISSETVSPNVLLPELEKGIYHIIITSQMIKKPNIICKKFCTEQLFLTVPPAHPLANNSNGIYLKALAGETMLLLEKIGIWKELIDSKMSQTKFILQSRDDAFSALIKASTLPAFATNLTLKHRERNENRIVLPILDSEASITFYCCVHESNVSYLPIL